MRRPLLACLAMLLLTLSACSDRSFVGQRVDNFSAYYNTFYNAQKAYDEGVEVLEQDDAPVDPDQYLPLFGGAERAAGPQFDRAIEKSADILRDHPSSKWVDDALMLIGKSYFHQHNFASAAQKFREVIARGGPEADTARFWLARALIAGGDYDAAEEHLQASLDAEGSLDGWRAMLELALGALRVEQGAWTEAAAALEKGLGGKVRGEDTRARARFLLGQVYETLDRPAAAAEAYAGAVRQRPRYELAYAAQMGAVRALGAAGETDRALERLRGMERDDKNASKRAEMALLRARLYQQKGQPSEAQRVLTRLLYDDEDVLLAPEVRGRAHYLLATLYRDAFRTYSLAAAHFDTAATALRGPEGAAAVRAATPVAVTDSRERAEAFGRVAEAARRVERLDSLLRLGRLSEAEFATFVDELRQRRAREAAARRRALDEEARQKRFAGRGEDFEDDEGLFETPGTTGASFLFHRDPARAQEAYVRFVERWGQRPLVPNWRRLRAISGNTRTAASGAPAEEAGVDRRQPARPLNPAIPDLDLSDVPRDPDSRLAIEAERAAARYELANALFFAIGRPDSAVVWYRRVVEDAAGRPVEQRAYYALAEAHDALGQDEQAARLYRQVVDRYPESDFAKRALAQLGEEAGPRLPAATEALGLAAEAAYKEAYAAWQRGAYLQALRGMTALAAAYRTTDEAPRALLAAGQIALEWAARTGRSPLAPLPLTVPDSLTQAGGLLAVGDPASAAEEEVPLTDPLNLTRIASEAPASARAQLPARTQLQARNYFASVVARYPASPYAARARLVLRGLNERRAAAGPLLAETRVPAEVRAAPQQPPAGEAEAEAAEAEAAEAEAAEAEAAEAEAASRPSESIAEEVRSAADEAEPDPAPRFTVPVETPPAPAAEQPPESLATPAPEPTADSSVAEAQQRREKLLPPLSNAPPVPVAERPAEPEDESLPEEAPAEEAPAEDAEASAPEAPVAESEADSAGWHAALYGPGRVSRERGGWTVAVASAERFAEADAAAQRYYDQGYRAGALARPPGTDGPRYRIGLGRFATRAAAEAAAAHLRAELPAEGLGPGALEPLRLGQAAPAAAAADSGRAAAEADAAGAPLPETAVSEVFRALTPAEREALRGDAPIRPSAGGWTLVVASRRARPQAELVAERYRRRGFRVGILAGQAEGETYLRVGIGQFPQEAQARAALRKLSGELPPEAWLLPVGQRN